MSESNKLWDYFMQWAMHVTESVKVKEDFKGQMAQIKQVTKNDKSGLITTILDFMIHSATVPFTFETGNSNFNNILENWKKNINKDVSPDIPRGIRSLTSQIYRERWYPSIIVVKMRWENVGGWILPTKIWTLNGSQIRIEEKEVGALGGLEYFLGDSDKPIKATANESLIIRKPYNNWYDPKVTPYLVKRGTLFNGLVKHELLTKQADVLEEIIPYILSIKGGNDAMLKQGVLPTKKEMEDIEEEIKKVKQKKRKTYGEGSSTAKLNYSVDLEHLLPDMTKFFNSDIVAPYDRNLLSSLGLIELQGFSKSREETVFNPKVLVEEVKDAVIDTAMIYEEIVMQIAEKNKKKHSKFLQNNINVVPGTIKAFITDGMKILARGAYDRGLIDKRSYVEDYLDLNFETVVSRRDIERQRNLERRMYPYVILNQEKDATDIVDIESPEDTKEQLPEKIKTEKDIDATYECLDPYCNAVLQIPVEATEGSNIRCSECGNIAHFYELNARKHKKKQPKSYATIDELPDSVKSPLPVGAQMIWLKTFNAVTDKTADEVQAETDAWSAVSEKYKKVSDKKKWSKKASFTDYKSQMSPSVYKFFSNIYDSGLEKGKSKSNSLETALAFVEKVCKKNNKGTWVKDKSLTKDQLDSIDSPDVMNSLLDLELKERKLKLLDKLLENK